MKISSKLLKSLLLISILSMVFSITSAFAKDTSPTDPVQEIQKTVYNFYESLNKKDSQLYLKSVANSERPANQYFASNFADVKIDFEIISIDKINNSNYEVKVSKKENGIQYPVIPYDVIFENGTWKFDGSNIVVYPKERVQEPGIKLDNIVSENENFIVSKIETINNDDITARDWRTYLFNQYSADIYSPGALGVGTLPGTNDYPDDGYNYVNIKLYKVEPGGELAQWDSAQVSAFANADVTFSCSGYHRVFVKNENYPQSGKYNVMW